MRIDSKEWTLASRRLSKKQSGGIHVYVNSQSLRNAGIEDNCKLEVKQYGVKGHKVILEFRKISE